MRVRKSNSLILLNIKNIIIIKTDQEKSSMDLDSAIDHIFLRKVPKNFSQWRTIITLLTIFYFVLATIIFIPLFYALIDLIFPRNTDPFPITTNLGAFTIILIMLLYLTHRKVIKYISAWPEEPPWIEKKNKVENTDKEIQILCKHIILPAHMTKVK